MSCCGERRKEGNDRVIFLRDLGVTVLRFFFCFLENLLFLELSLVFFIFDRVFGLYDIFFINFEVFKEFFF